MKPYGFVKINKKLSLRVSLERCLHCPVKYGKAEEAPWGFTGRQSSLFIPNRILVTEECFSRILKDGKKVFNGHFIFVSLSNAKGRGTHTPLKES